MGRGREREEDEVGRGTWWIEGEDGMEEALIAN